MKISWGVSTALVMSTLSFVITNAPAEESVLGTIVVVGEIPSSDSAGLLGSKDALS